jgi:TolA-binding protein
MDMLKTNLLVFAFGIVIGGALHHVSMNSVKEDMGAISSSLESKLNGISQQLSESRRFSPDVIATQSTTASAQSASWEELLADLKQSVQMALESSVRPIIQEELEFSLSQLPQSNQVAAQSVETVDPQQDSENTMKAEQVLSMAVSNGVWNKQSMDAYNDALSHMSGENQAEAFRQLSVAINNGDVYIEDDVSFY